jgi:M6 family metalloprotease-like protein
MLQDIYFVVTYVLCILSITPVGCIAPPSRYGYPSKINADISHGVSTNSTSLSLQLLSSDFCREMTDNECQNLDDLHVQRTRVTRKLIASFGTLKPLVLCVKFQDHADRDLPSREKIRLLWNGKAENIDPDILPTGSIREYLKNNSYGKLLIDAEVKNWVMTDNTEKFYSFGASGKDYRIQRAMNPVLDAWEALGEDFSQYDQDGDGILDTVVMMHSGFPAESEEDDCYDVPYQYRIWAHTVTVNDNDSWVSSDGKFRIGTYTVASALRTPPDSSCSKRLARLGVVTHEFIHTWGLPDLYEISPYGQIGYGSGYYDIMSDPNGVDGSQIRPCNLSPWSKIRSGWLKPIEITDNGEYFIEASAISPCVYIIRHMFAQDEYLLIENRQPIGYDSDLWGGGLLIWHIDDNVENNDNAGYPGLEGWPGNGIHYRVAVLAADRKYHLERGINQGNNGDFWTKGDELSPGPTDYEASNFSEYPNTNSYTNVVTGIRIYDISASKTVMSFKVEGIVPLGPPTLTPSRPPTPRPTPTPFAPSSMPSGTHSIHPSSIPSNFATSTPTRVPSHFPTQRPNMRPSNIQSSDPSILSSSPPTLFPTLLPSSVSSNVPIELIASRTPSFRDKTSEPGVENQVEFRSEVPLSLNPSSNTSPTTSSGYVIFPYFLTISIGICVVYIFG